MTPHYDVIDDPSRNARYHILSKKRLTVREQFYFVALYRNTNGGKMAKDSDIIVDTDLGCWKPQMKLAWRHGKASGKTVH